MTQQLLLVEGVIINKDWKLIFLVPVSGFGYVQHFKLSLRNVYFKKLASTLWWKKLQRQDLGFYCTELFEKVGKMHSRIMAL